MRAALVVAIGSLFVWTIGCGGSQKKTGGGVASGSGSGSASVAPDGDGSGSPGPGSAVAPDAPVTRDECAAMIGHILDIAAGERTGAKAPEGDEAATARKKLIDAQAEPCMQQTSRASYTCAMAAKSSADLKACPE